MLSEHSAILLTFIKLPFVFKTLVLSIIEWPLKTGFTVDPYNETSEFRSMEMCRFHPLGAWSSL